MASLLADLRALAPARPLAVGEDLRVAELQASRLLGELGITGPPVPESVVAAVPRLRVERRTPLPTSGATRWTKGRWIIVLNGAEPTFRQRFSLLHELKHVIDGPRAPLLHAALRGLRGRERAERVADFFAACALMPRSWLTRAWRRGVRDCAVLACMFEVSQIAMHVRLRSIGVREAPQLAGTRR